MALHPVESKTVHSIAFNERQGRLLLGEFLQYDKSGHSKYRSEMQHGCETASKSSHVSQSTQPFSTWTLTCCRTAGEISHSLVQLRLQLMIAHEHGSADKAGEARQITKEVAGSTTRKAQSGCALCSSTPALHLPENGKQISLEVLVSIKWAMCMRANACGAASANQRC